MKQICGAIVTLSGAVVAASVVVAHAINQSGSARGDYVPLAWGAAMLVVIGFAMIFIGWRDQT